ncbi:MAG TPA: thioredoxin family protein [Xanthomonadaceae bacterium]|nr:thioredoxin family protein [Xanthomonadaceae bacterium]
MAFVDRYATTAPDRADVDAIAGAVVVEFGTDWCGHCQAARPWVQAAFAAHPDVHHIKVEDGRGRRLGRSFGVKLWPTLVFLSDGVEVARVVRPTEGDALSRAFKLVTPC